MKIRSRSLAAVVASATLVLGTVVMAAPASAATTKLWLVNVSAFPQPWTVCIDEVLVASFEPSDVVGPVDTESGDHLVEVMDGADADCTEDIPGFSETLTIPDTASTTLMVYAPVEGYDVSVFADDLSCTPAGSGRLLVRNAALTYDSDGPGWLAPLDLDGFDPAGDPIALATDLPTGEEEVQVLAPGVYTDLVASPQQFPPELFDLTIEEGVVTALYLYGGTNSGVSDAITSLVLTSEVGVCGDTTTTSSSTTTSTSTTTAAPASQAATTSPRYTG